MEPRAGLEMEDSGSLRASRFAGCPRSSRPLLGAGRSGSAVRERCRARWSRSRSRGAFSHAARRKRNADDPALHGRPTANVAEVARVIAGFAAEDPTILEGAAQMPDANAASPASVATDEQFDPDYLPGDLGASPEIAPTPTLRNEPRRQQDADEFDPDYLP